VTFSANGTNAAKNTVATFTRAGSYGLQVTVTDQSNLTVTSSVNVTVNQTLTAISVAPASATVTVGGSVQFTASARDQFGQALAGQPAFAWTVSGGGTMGATGSFTAGGAAGGPFTVTASSGGRSGTASVTITSAQPLVIGEPNVLSTDDYGNGSLLVAQPASLGQTATLPSLSFYVTAAARKLRLGVYDATAPSGGARREAGGDRRAHRGRRVEHGQRAGPRVVAARNLLARLSRQRQQPPFPEGAELQHVEVLRVPVRDAARNVLHLAQHEQQPLVAA